MTFLTEERRNVTEQCSGCLTLKRVLVRCANNKVIIICDNV